MADGIPTELATLARWRATGLPTTTPGTAALDAAAEVRRLGAVQAQEFEMTLWSLGRRTGESRERVLGRFERGEFVRVHALRQTWHFVHRDDLTRVQAATAHRVHRLNAGLYRQEGLDTATLARVAGVVEGAVGERPRTRAEIGAALAADGIETTGFRLGLIMMWAELECLVVSGPLDGKRHTYSGWPDRALADPSEASAWLARRFFESHGPATLDDFAAWSSLTKGQANEAVAGSALRHAEVGGVACVWLGELSHDPWDSPQVELLNCYDEYVSGLSARGKQALDRAGLWSQRLGIPNGLVMVDGQLAGHWRRVADGAGVRVEVLALRAFGAGELSALERNAAALGEFVGRPSRVQVRALE